MSVSASMLNERSKMKTCSYSVSFLVLIFCLHFYTIKQAAARNRRLLDLRFGYFVFLIFHRNGQMREALVVSNMKFLSMVRTSRKR